jgi:hypothetical protein
MSIANVVAEGTVSVRQPGRDLVTQFNGRIMALWGYQLTVEPGTDDIMSIDTEYKVTVVTFREWLPHLKPLDAFLRDTFGDHDYRFQDKTGKKYINVHV